MPLHNVLHVRISSLLLWTLAAGLTLGVLASAPGAVAQRTPDGAAAPAAGAQTPAPASAGSAPAPAQSAPAAKGKKDKDAYTGPTTVVVLPATPMLDNEGKQRLDPDGKPMFNPPVKQIRDKKGHPVFGAEGKPVFETPGDLGYDEKGKKIVAKKEKAPKATPMSVSNGTLTVDGWTGKARLNYDIADLKFLYIYVPGIGVSVVSQNQFPGATEQAGAFNDKTLRITVDGHPIEVASEKRLLEKKPMPAWVAVDRSFQLPSKFPVFGYGATARAPYVWPGSKESAVATGAVAPPPLPADLRPTPLLAPCPAGTMRPAGPPVLPGQKAGVQPCVPIAATPAATSPAPGATPAH